MEHRRAENEAAPPRARRNANSGRWRGWDSHASGPAQFAANTIARAAHRLDQRRITGGIHLLAQSTDVNVNHVGLRVEMVIPNPLEEHGARHHLARTTGEKLENGPFAGLQLEFARTAPGRTAEQIENQIANPDIGLHRLAPTAPGQGLESRQQLGERKGLDKIIITAGTESRHAILDTAPRREKKDRDFYLILAQGFDDRKPVEARQHAVDHQRIERPTDRQRKPLRTILGAVDGPTAFAQALLEEACRLVVVFDHQNAHPASCSRSETLAAGCRSRKGPRPGMAPVLFTGRHLIRQDVRRIAILNRGDAALRCLRTIRARREQDGTPLVAIAFCTGSDLDAPFVRLADELVQLDDSEGELAAWLDRERIFEAIARSRADAVWPGWGFLAEDPLFVEGLETRGILFIGPTAASMRQLGDKIAAKRVAESVGVAVVPWNGGPVEDQNSARTAAEKLGWPLLVKASAGGGGRGIRVVTSIEGLEEALRSARAEARIAFGDDRLFLERRLEGGRHIEVQIAGDTTGCVRTLGLRDCSVQRRHQKLIEEAPPPRFDPALAARLEDSAIRIAHAVDYRGLGTVEFLVRDGEAFFLEVNPRLQVEHAITEETTGLDLVALQFELAEGLHLDEFDISPNSGVAIEARVCAEDPEQGFAPAPGKILRFDPASGPGIRIEAGVVVGGTVASAFDSLVARVIARGRTREEARARLRAALAETDLVLAGGTTNKGFLMEVLDTPDFHQGTIDTGWLDRRMTAATVSGIATSSAASTPSIDADALVAAAILGYRRTRESERRAFFADPSLADPARAPGSSGHEIDLRCRGVDARLRVLAEHPGVYRVRLDGLEITATLRTLDTSYGWLEIASRMRKLSFDADDAGVRLELDGRPQRFDWQAGGRVRAATPGSIVRVDIRPGDPVSADQTLGLLEAMKMEVAFRSPASGVVREVLVAPGQTVRAGDLLAVIESEGILAKTDGQVLKLPAEAVLIRPTNDPEGAILGFDVDEAELRALAAALEPATDGAETLSTGGVDPSARHVFFTPVRDGGGGVERLDGDSLGPRVKFFPVTDGSGAAENLDGRALPAERLRASVVTFSDLEILFDRTPRTGSDGEPGPSSEACLRLHLRRMREAGHGLDPAFVLDLERALAHYGTTSLAPGPSLERALLRIFAARRTGVLRHELARAAIRQLESRASAGLGLRHDRGLAAALDRIATLRGTVPDALADAAAEARHAIFDEPRLRRRLGGLASGSDPDAALLESVRARFSAFDLETLQTPPGLEAFLAHDREDVGDDRLFVIARVRGRSHRSGRLTRLHLAAFEGAFHDATRLLRTVLAERDPERRLQWNRIWLLVEPAVAPGPSTINELVRRLAPATRRLGLERVVVRFRQIDPLDAEIKPRDVELAVSDLTGTRLHAELREPHDDRLRPRSAYERRMGEARRRGYLPPHEVVPLLGETFEEFDLDGAADARKPRAKSVKDRPPGEHRAGLIFGIVTSFTPELPEGLPRVAILSDPTRGMGALGEAECARIVAALDLACARNLAVDWIPVSSGARIALDSGTENLDATARVVRRIIRFTRAGGAIHIVVDGPNVGAQAYFDALSTMMPESRGLLIMTPRGSMVLTGRAALEASGSASAEDEVAIGGYERTAGPNGEAHHLARDLASACQLLLEHHRHATPAPGQAGPPRRSTIDTFDRDVSLHAYPADAPGGFATVGEILADGSNPGRRRPFAIRPVMRALIDIDSVPLERWRDQAGAETAVVQDAFLGGQPICLIGIENRNLPRLGRRPPDGPGEWTGGTLFPQSSKKIARAIAAASGVRPVVVLANLSGFDGSPESLRKLQLEHGAAIARAVVGFEGPLLFLVLSRYHGGAYVVFSRHLNPSLAAGALEGAFASVIGGSAAATVVLGREVESRAALDPAVDQARRLAADSPSAAHHAALDRARAEALARARAAVASEFDTVHDVARALRVGSLETILPASQMRPWLIGRLGDGGMP